MPCYYPLRGWREPFPGPNGKYRITGIKARSSQSPAPPGACAVDIPCGQCIGCRLERSRKWAQRCMNEASLYDQNCFITLTYDDVHLPAFGALEKSSLQKFFKRFRKQTGGRIRFFACGEYGSRLGRPHYHSVVFGYDFPDKKLWKTNDSGNLYTSDLLSKLWPFGFSTVGACTFESCAYVARYVLKKVTGDIARQHYTKLDPVTGELFEVPPEFVNMSRRPGIGAKWLDKFSSDVYPSDFMISRGHKMKPPRYYDNRYQVDDPDTIAAVKRRREELAYLSKDDSTLNRLKVREAVVKSQLSFKKRSFEDD